MFFQRAGNNLNCFGHSDIIPDRVIIGICFQRIVKCVKRSIGQSGDHMAVGKPYRAENIFQESKSCKQFLSMNNPGKNYA